MDAVGADRFRRACNALGVHDPDVEYKKLVNAWQSWGRRYHTLEHLAACLRELDEVSGCAHTPAEVELALWFHDAIYRTYRSDNEARSAAWAARFLGSHGAAADAVGRVRDSVLATRHEAHPAPGDAALVVDIDLSILGQPVQAYDAFERNVRREYWWVSRRRTQRLVAASSSRFSIAPRSISGRSFAIGMRRQRAATSSARSGL